MYRIFVSFRWSGLLLVLLALTVGGGAGVAQESAALCSALIEVVEGAVAGSCGGLGVDQACYGYAEVLAEPVEGGSTVFAAPGDMIALVDLNRLATGAADPEQDSWGVAVLRAQADLPAGAPPLEMILFGEAEMTNLVEPGAEAAPTVTVQNAAGYPVNLRAGAGTNYPVVGTLDDDAQAVADGRNAAGDWFRIQTEGGLAWIFGDLISVAEGDPAALHTLEPDDILPAFSAPMQAFSLATASDGQACGAASSGLLLRLAGEDPAHLQINGVNLAFSAATLLVQAPSEAGMDIMVLDGAVSVAANGVGVTANTGAWVEVEYANESGPLLHQAYPFAAVEGAPLGLVPDSVACQTGVAAADEEVTLYTGPGDAYRVLAPMDPELHYTVTGQAADDAGAVWWRLDLAGYGQAWVQRDAVRTLGVCDQIAEVEAPPLVSEPSGGQAAGSGLVPAGQSVWQANPGLDNMSGTCSGPALAYCAHLVAITPNGDGTISWRGQEMTPYTLSPAGENTYTYSGRNALGNGNVQMALTFTSETTWSMTLTTTLDSDPACQHTFYYTAARSW